MNKCISTKATLIVPDMEDSVPPEEKPKSRFMIKEKLRFIRDGAYSERVVITKNEWTDNWTLSGRR